MYFYLFFGLMFLFFSVSVRTEEDSRSRKLTAGLFFFIVFLFTGLRSPEVGNDSMQFYQAYTRICGLSWTDHSKERYEWGFFALCKLLGIFFPHPQTIFIFTAMVFSASVYRFILLYSRNSALSCFLFLFLNLWAVYVNLMRQILALCIILYSIKFLQNGKNLRFCVGVASASLFHRSAWICLIMLFFYRQRFSVKAVLVFIPFTAFCFWQYDRIFSLAAFVLNRYSGYRTSEQFGKSNYLGMLFNVGICLAILLYGALLRHGKGTDALEPLSEDFQIYMLLCCLFCYVLGMRMYILSRITPYFTIFYLSWLGAAEPFVKMEAIPLLPADPRHPKIFLKRVYPLETHLTALTAVVYFCVIHLFRPEWQGIIPYLFFWQE